MTADPKRPSDSSPFAKLAGLRSGLPAGPATATSTATSATSAKKERPLFLDKVVVRHERKGHGGKTVTVVTGVAAFALDSMCAEMKRALGCGARVEDGAVVLQGDLVPRAIAFLEKKGAKKIVQGSK